MLVINLLLALLICGGLSFGQEIFGDRGVCEATKAADTSKEEFVPTQLEKEEYIRKFKKFSDEIGWAVSLPIQVDNPFHPESLNKTKILGVFAMDSGAVDYFITDDIVKSVGATAVGKCFAAYPINPQPSMLMYAVRLVADPRRQQPIAVNITACSGPDVGFNLLGMHFKKHFGLCYDGIHVSRC
jgi:hypothetical protein